MDLFKDNYIYLDVEGYILFHKEIDYASSSPLLSWRKNSRRDRRLHWGCQNFEKPNQSFWLTELCLVKGKNDVRHLVPGAYLRTRENTISAKTFRYVWMNILDKYTFHSDEINDQFEVRKFLLDMITPETVLFYKGGKLESMIGELCGAQESVNLEDLGVTGKAVISEPLVTDISCKVHEYRFNHCPLQETCYYMKKIDEWLPKYMPYK